MEKLGGKEGKEKKTKFAKRKLYMIQIIDKKKKDMFGGKAFLKKKYFGCFLCNQS